MPMHIMQMGFLDKSENFLDQRGLRLIVPRQVVIHAANFFDGECDCQLVCITQPNRTGQDRKGNQYGPG